MSAKNKLFLFVFLLAISFAAMKTSLFYRARYLDAWHQLRQQQEQANTLKQRLDNIASLDKKYVSQLQQAKQSVSQLERDVAAGKRRLQLAASCRAASGTAGMADAARPGLNDAAKRHYFDLRQGIETAHTQIAGLQEYIRQQCQP